MNRWIASVAVIALILASMSIWYGNHAGFSTSYATDIWVTSTIVAFIAESLGWLNAISRSHRGWMAAFSSLLAFAQMLMFLHFLPEFDSYTDGPFCSRYLTESSAVSTLCPPPWYSILLFSPVFALSIASLMYAFWPHKQNQVIAVEERV
jgi:hypothetical protein